jgi:hypothetical protein
MAQARGIHDHPTRKLGYVPTTRSADELLQVRWAVDPTSVAPTEVDHSDIVAGLDNNDKWGICGPTSADNITRTITKYEFGTQINATQDQVNTLYTESSDPPFDPATGANDNGVENPMLYDAWRKNGLAGYAPIAFGQLTDISDASIALALDTFGAATMAVDLEVAQQAQSDEDKIVWDYKKSAEWGGHDVCISYISKKNGSVVGCWTWAEWALMTPEFRAKQGIEVFVPVFAAVLASNKFNTNVDADAMASQFKTLTGEDLVIPGPSPAPPAPSPTSVLTLNITDQEIANHIIHAAGTHPTDMWAEHHFKSYFRIKE